MLSIGSVAAAVRLASDVLGLSEKLSNYFNFNDASSIELSLRNHLDEAFEWATHSSVLGSGLSYLTKERTVALFCNDSPRRFLRRTTSTTVQDVELLNISDRILLLGDPGSGKTTTIKRILLDLEFKDNEKSFVFLVVARRLGPSETLFDRLTRLCGLYSSQILIDKATKPRTIEKPNGQKETISSFDSSVIEAIQLDALIDIFESYGILILFDGLDEISEENAFRCIQQIESLSRRLYKSRFLITCRSGSYQSILGFNTAEVAELTDAQLREISENFAEEPAQFMAEIRDKPYLDLLRRPLFLTHSIMIFNHSKSLPARPTALQNRILFVALREWNEYQNIHKRSIYANFEIEEKIEFLSAVAFDLVKNNTIEFDLALVQKSCEEVGFTFGIRYEDASKVAAEIESHTGIIVKVGFNQLMFAHLSMQEYLAANYLIKSEGLAEAHDIFHRYPEIVAVATVSSTRATNYFAQIVYRYHLATGAHNSLLRYLYRVFRESLRFKVSVELGRTVLRLAVFFDKVKSLDSDLDHLSAFNAIDKIALKQFSESLLKELVGYKCSSGSDAIVLLDHRGSIHRNRNALNSYRVGRVNPFFQMITCAYRAANPDEPVK